MLVVTRPVSRKDHYVQDEVLELRCHGCKRCFTKLQDAYLCYVPPQAGMRSEAVWVHKGCGERTPTEGRPTRLVRSDYALQRLLESLLKPAIPTAALTDDRSGRGRQNWSST